LPLPFLGEWGLLSREIALGEEFELFAAISL
jgi:hypothetical protein